MDPVLLAIDRVPPRIASHEWMNGDRWNGANIAKRTASNCTEKVVLGRFACCTCVFLIQTSEREK